MKAGDRFLYNEDGMLAKVTLMKYELVGGKWHSFELQVDELVHPGPYRLGVCPKPGDVMIVGYRDGYRHYAGWEIERLEG